MATKYFNGPKDGQELVMKSRFPGKPDHVIMVNRYDDDPAPETAAKMDDLLKWGNSPADIAEAFNALPGLGDGDLSLTKYQIEQKLRALVALTAQAAQTLEQIEQAEKQIRELAGAAGETYESPLGVVVRPTKAGTSIRWSSEALEVLAVVYPAIETAKSESLRKPSAQIVGLTSAVKAEQTRIEEARQWAIIDRDAALEEINPSDHILGTILGAMTGADPGDIALHLAASDKKVEDAQYLRDMLDEYLYAVDASAENDLSLGNAPTVDLIAKSKDV